MRLGGSLHLRRPRHNPDLLRLRLRCLLLLLLKTALLPLAVLQVSLSPGVLPLVVSVASLASRSLGLPLPIVPIAAVGAIVHAVGGHGGRW